jgi:hypothetical protein
LTDISSEKGTFSIYYGEENMIYGPNGVDLSEFNCAIREIIRPHERIFESLCNWLTSGLRINQETHSVSVQYVINRTTHTLIWELMPLASNDDWSEKYTRSSYPNLISCGHRMLSGPRYHEIILSSKYLQQIFAQGISCQRSQLDCQAAGVRRRVAGRT